MTEIELLVLVSRFAVCRMEPGARIDIPAAAELFCAARTAEELSIVCEEHLAPPGARIERGWRALKVAGPLDFALTGILAGLSGALAAHGVSLFAISTYDTDYILVREKDLPGALDALHAAGYVVPRAPGPDRI
jgi:hypothetical protein